MAVQTVRARRNLASASTAIEMSPNIWYDCPMAAIRDGSIRGVWHDDDFVASYDVATNQTTVLRYGPYEIYTGNGTNLLMTAGVTGAGGHQTFVTGDTADINSVMTVGGGAPFLISSTATTSKLWFETRFKISSVTTADQVQFFIGLTEEDRAAANGVFADGGGDLGFTTTIDLIGFARFDDDGDSLSFVYQKGSQTAQDALQIVLAADTFIKVGFVWDPLAPTANRIKVFADNVEQTTYVTGTQATAATFPDGEELTPTISTANDSTTSNTLTVDWVKCYQII